MTDIAHSAADMISGMTPTLKHGDYVFVSTIDPAVIKALEPHAIATFQEVEGTSLLVPVAFAKAQNQNTDHPMRCITLNVYSSLEGVGLTAAVAVALADSDIACNMIAAHHHDHAFVPSAKAEQALMVLKALQSKPVG